jgi:glycerol-3-phosphate acyltransferase PlsY
MLILQIFLIIILGFIFGSIPFSFLFPFWFSRVDVRHYGDGNPGAANAFKAGGWLCGFAALLLDFIKGCVPVFVARIFFHIDDLWIIPISIAPIAGHVYSPFLGWKGGKAITTSFGVWTGLTLYSAPLLLGACCTLFLFLVRPAAWATMLAFISFMIIFPLIHPDVHLILFSLANFVIILHRHLRDLHQPISFGFRKKHG